MNNGIERIIEGVKVENIKVKERTVKKIKQAVDEFRRQGKPADLSQKDKEGRRSLLTGDLKDKIKGVVKEFSPLTSTSAILDSSGPSRAD